jgi:hypothetical protein
MFDLKLKLFNKDYKCSICKKRKKDVTPYTVFRKNWGIISPCYLCDICKMLKKLDGYYIDAYYDYTISDPGSWMR